MTDWRNRLYFGDNLPILREGLPDESVDLIYLDPPFNSNATYKVLFREASGEESAAQIQTFDDTWHWDIGSRGGLPRGGRPGAEGVGRSAPGHALLPGPERHDGLSDDDGAADGGTAPRVEADGQHLSPLRPYRQPLHQTLARRHIRGAQFPRRGFHGSARARTAIRSRAAVSMAASMTSCSSIRRATNGPGVRPIRPTKASTSQAPTAT